MLVKEIRKGRHNGGVGSDLKIGNVLVQGRTNGGLRIESWSRIRVGPMDGPEFRDRSWCYTKSYHHGGVRLAGIQ